jgi:hypothetical protein
MTRYFEYGDEEIAYLKSRDKKLAAAIDAVGHVYREMEGDDLFAGVVHHIVGQQISSAAMATVWNRLLGTLGEVSPETVHAATEAELQACGITFKKAAYIKGFAEKVVSGAFDIDAVEHMSDADAIAAGLIHVRDTWNRVVDDTEDARSEALRRHGPAIYRSVVAEAVTPLCHESITARQHPPA